MDKDEFYQTLCRYVRKQSKAEVRIIDALDLLEKVKDSIQVLEAIQFLHEAKDHLFGMYD